MTTITIERALLEQAYAMLSSNKTHIRVVMSRDETCVAIRAALAAPATAPEPTTAVAVNRLCKALREDLEYAWSWHCNIAMTAFDAGCPKDVANEGAARFMQLLAGVDTRNHPGFQVTQDFYLPSTAPATAPESGVMTEIDYNDDDALRFVQRVLESDAPLSDIRDARNMVVEIRTRVLKARASKPATAPEPICTKCGDVITAHDPGLCGCCLSTRDTTTPVQPSWHDAPTVPGLWVCRQAITDNIQAYEVTDQMALNRNLKLKGQWYGPIPEDRQ